MDTLNYLFGPLSSQYCLVFYLISAYFLIVTVLLIVGFVFQLFSKKMNEMVVFAFILSTISHFVIYIGYRLLYNMCMNTIRP